MKDESLVLTIGVLLTICLISACGGNVKTAPANANVLPIQDVNSNAISPAQTASNTNSEASKIPNLQTEILDQRNSKTTAPIGSFNFRNYTYPLPRGWKAAGTNELTIENGSLPATDKSIGASYVASKYGDVTGDGVDEAFVIIKIETEGSAIPQVVYIFSEKDGKPEMIWFFRTGDRADGGLKDVRTEDGELVVELYGKDRYLFGEIETMQIAGDKEQLCCPEFFARSHYKWNGKNFQMQGKRETYSVANPNSPPIDNESDVINQQNQKSKK